jgi:hypothetical protein
MIQVSLDVTLYSVRQYPIFPKHFTPLNIGTYLPHYTVYHAQDNLHKYCCKNLTSHTQEHSQKHLTLSNPIFLPPAYSPALIYFGWERSWWITCNYPTVLKEKNRNRKSTTCTMLVKVRTTRGKTSGTGKLCRRRSVIGSERVKNKTEVVCLS